MGDEGDVLKAALISNGPSAANYDPSENFDVVVCARAAAGLIDCDYWCIADWRGYALGRESVANNPMIVTRTTADQKMELHGPEHLARWNTERKMFVDRFIHPDVPENWKQRWYCWSGSLALGLMLWLKPKELFIYGMDLCGEVDCAGKHDPNNRTEDRWRDEREICDRLLHQLTDQGTQYYRTLHGGHIQIGGPHVIG